MRNRVRRTLLIILRLALLLLCTAVFAISARAQSSSGSKRVVSSRMPTLADFVGSEACAECHVREFDLWSKSTHGRAGGSPRTVTVLGKFDGTPLQFRDARVTPVTGTDNQRAFLVAQKGFPERRFEVEAAIGGGHMEGGGTQTYFAKFPDGTLRFLPFDFIRDENVWFGETRGAQGWVPISDKLSITELGEWPPSRILGTHMSAENCQGCHGSQIQISYDTQKKKYMTQYKSLAINCESCHGPARRHVEIARSDEIHQLRDIGMKALATLNKNESLNVCFQCHAVKDALDSGYLPGMDLQEYYSLKFPVFGETPFHPDGRVKEFGYQQNHLYSDCYLNGSMTCVDCHDPHSQQYRDITGKSLTGKFDNGQCTGCHASKGQAPERHSNHKSDSPGNLCTSCHMPFLQHKSVGKHLRFARSDHTIPIPRPVFDAEIGVENACQKCHSDKSIAWLQDKTEEWYGQIKPHQTLVANLVDKKNIRSITEAAQLLLVTEPYHPMAQISGLSFFIQNFLSPDMPKLEPQLIEKLKALVELDDVDLRALALMSLHFSQDSNPQVRGYLLEQLQTLNSEKNLVRKRWALALAFLAGRYRVQGNPGRAIKTYHKALEVMPNDAATLVNLGVTYRQHSDLDNAIIYYRKALAVKPDDSMAWVNLGIAFQEKGEFAEELSAYRNAIESNPWNHLGHFNLGNYSYTRKDYDSAIAAYERAVAIDPSLALGHFYLARSYVQTRALAKAAASFRAGLQYKPDEQGAKQMLRDIERYLSNQ